MKVSTPPFIVKTGYNISSFIAEFTARAFIIADSNKRRTLSRSDIAKALSKSDQFDFLIDIVPRDELPFPGATGANGTGKKAGAASNSKRDQGSTPDGQAGALEIDNGEDFVASGNEVIEQLESLLGSTGQPERGSLS